MGWRSRVLAERVDVTRCGERSWVLGMHISEASFPRLLLGGALSQLKLS